MNYFIGRWIGKKVFSSKSRWIDQGALLKTHAFYEKHGGKTIIIARFLPIIRTFAPFIAGVSEMNFSRFQFFNITGAALWVFGLVIAGYFFGNIPIIRQNLNVIVLIGVGIFGAQSSLSTSEGKWIAFSMLFAMGIQNSLVTKISQSTVRTTHLTGLFTDLGIELSQLFFYKKTEEVKKLKTSIFLRLSIITFFFIGCFSGGIIYQFIAMKTLFVAALCLFVAQWYDYFRLKFHLIKRKKLKH